MTLLNTPMPAERALKILESTYDSNKTIITSFKYYLVGWWAWEWHICNYADFINERYEIDESREITINSISQIIPTYSIWDKALILSTGEMAEVKLIVIDSYWPIERNWVYIECEWENLYYHRSEICKLPNDL